MRKILDSFRNGSFDYKRAPLFIFLRPPLSLGYRINLCFLDRYVFSGFQSKLICRNWRQWKKPMMSKSFLPWLGASIKKLQREKGHIELRR
ncbi:uncharacterized protein LOC111919755 isoform X2 [Lactuca sativa]|uniref:Uncharacterized protein n=2 Tax=Lactuca sativa TaxID=4236 RepID=A0A9R1URR7_LACSA|nr:uncharacterized protein LOC111919755 isoform X2 [Lactuca sativa]KAJ0191753.1 hypothetical protein LSAT_V11C800394920 [Lactuca sativa]